MDDRARVEELLGRPPRGPFDVAVRDSDGDPIVVRNAPFLDDGTPMPTRYYLVGRELVTAVSRLEAAGGVREAEATISPEEITAVHARYAAERDAVIDPAHEGPRPFGGVGGTRQGVKCLHAHVAHHLVTGDDPVGAWAMARLDASSTVPATGAAAARPGTLCVRPDDHSTALFMSGGGSWTLPVGSVGLADTIFADRDRPPPEELSNAFGFVHDHFEDVVMDAPCLLAAPGVIADGPHVEMLARVEIGTTTLPSRVAIQRADLEEVFRTLVAEDDTDRASNPGLDPAHVHSIVGSCCVILGIMRRLQVDELTIQATTATREQIG